ncbi:hypothetical protein SAMN05421579_12556 [Xenorhabdus japonica]|uniref:Uncharacterized protein n=1 Tax=Xenorhabdus japonica TaxID=53341 RepID=A0A1I5CD45_9GAMM|nr:hypothetical protein SAMN05421579_12556 [Xenorhabdus japonica]
MVTVEVKCRFCQQVEYVKNMAKARQDINAIAVSPANEPFNSSTPIGRAKPV